MASKFNINKANPTQRSSENKERQQFNKEESNRRKSAVPEKSEHARDKGGSKSRNPDDS